MSKSRFKVAFCFIPRRLAVNDREGMRFVGWVWMQKAHLTNNMSHGWVAFLNNQTEERLSKCPCCGRYLKEGE